MNKQEVIEEIKKLEGLTILDKTINFDSKMISKENVLNIVKQLDDPENPKKKLYTVEIPNPYGIEHPILFKNRDGKVSVVFASNPFWRTVKGAKLTEAEIKEYFGWAFRWAKEVEE